MNVDPQDWYGYFAAAPTPFTRDGKLDDGALAEVVTHFSQNRAHGIVVNGSTGEWFTQTPDERRRVAQVGRDVVSADHRYLVGVSSIDPAETISLAQHAAEIGADGVMISLPPARRLNQAEIVRYFQDVCRQITCPVMLYNIPPDVVSDIRPTTIVELAKLDNVVAVKDSTPSDLQFLETGQLASSHLRVFGNVLTVPAMSMLLAGQGCHGHFGSGMPLGRRLADAFEHAREGRPDQALAIAKQFAQLRTALTEFLDDANPWGMHAEAKATLELAGVPAGYPRWPQSGIQDDPAAMSRLRGVLQHHGAL